MRASPAVLAVAAAAWAAASAAAAAEWRNTPTVVFGGGSDTNIRLTPDHARHVVNSSLAAVTEVSGRSSRLDFSVRPQVRSLRYDDPREADRDDVFAVVQLARRNAHGTWSVGTNYANESTLTSEFEPTGFVEIDIDRVQTALDTRWTRRSGSRGELGVTALVTDVDYEEAFLSPLVDYRYRTLRTSYSYAASAHSTVTVGGGGSRVETPTLRTATDSVSVDVAWSRVFSAGLEATFGLGGYHVDSQGPFGTAGTGPSLTFNVRQEWPRWTLQAGGARELIPDGRGTLAREDAVELEAARRMTERLTLGVAVRGARVGHEGSTGRAAARDYAQASATLQWRFAERWALYAAVLERAQVVPGERRAAGRQGLFSVSYRGG